MSGLRRCERGSISIVVAAAVGMALVVTMGAADVGRAVIARSRAEAVADLAALAAAQELALPSGIDPSTVAAEYADRNGARLLSCSCAPGTLEAVVEVAVRVRGFLLPLADRDVIGSARAVVDLPT
jgi:secretion/DNA translocation related TadE-like protein